MTHVSTGVARLLAKSAVFAILSFGLMAISMIFMGFGKTALAILLIAGGGLSLAASCGSFLDAYDLHRVQQPIQR